MLNLHKGYRYGKVFSEKIRKEALDLKKPSYLDLKIGTNCVLRSIESKSYAGFREYDLMSTSVEHGYRVTGYCLYHNNQVQEYVCEDYSQTRYPHQVKNTLKKLFTSPTSNKLIDQRYLYRII